VVKKVCNGIKLYWSGWKFTVYKLLAYGYLNDLNKLRRHYDKHLKVVKSHSHISTQVQSCTISISISIYFAFIKSIGVVTHRI